MANDKGAVRFLSDGAIYFYEYQGTVDVALDVLYRTEEELRADWHNYETRRCSCGRDEAVEIMTFYGGGTYWDGRACRYCLTITEGKMPFHDYLPYTNGEPEWSPFKHQ